MTTPVARGVAYGQQLTNHMEEFLGDNFTVPLRPGGRPRPQLLLERRGDPRSRPRSVAAASSNCESTASRSTRERRTRWRRSADPVIPNATSKLRVPVPGRRGRRRYDTCRRHRRVSRGTLARRLRGDGASRDRRGWRPSPEHARRRAVSVYPARRRLRGRRGVLRDVHDTAQEHVSRCRA